MARATVRIERPDDPRVEDYRDIRERDLVGRRGLFVAEGAVVLAAALDGGRHRLRSVLASEARAAGDEGLLARVPDDVPVYVAGAAVMNAVAGFDLHRGLVAIGERAPDPGADALLAGLGPRGLALVALGIANHDNMGGLFRAAAAFGVGAVILDRGSCDPLYRKAIRVSVGHALRVPFATVADEEAALDALERAGTRALALTPGGALAVEDARPTGPTALVVGAEGPGLRPGVLDRVETLRIDMPGRIDSLNVATAAAIALHRLSSQAAWRLASAPK
mgnify:CR=1 FL=1